MSACPRWGASLPAVWEQGQVRLSLGEGHRQRPTPQALPSQVLCRWAVIPAGAVRHGRSQMKPRQSRCESRAQIRPTCRLSSALSRRLETGCGPRTRTSGQGLGRTEKARDARVLRGLEAGQTWIVWDGDVPAATITITPQINPAVWSTSGCTCDLSESAVFVHRMITARKYSGSGLGAELLDWAGLRGRRLYGAKWIRTDVWSTNKALHDFLRWRGFEPCGFCDDPEYPSGALFQKPVSAITISGTPMFREEIATMPMAREYGKMLGMALVGNQLRMISIQADGAVRFFDPHNQSHAVLYVASLEAYFWQALVDELEALINKAGVSESQLQSFFERNPNFLCADTYETAYPHIVLQRPEAGPLIPDFALKPYNENALCDLLEIKLPSAKLVVGSNNRKRLSAALMEACAQLREYRDYFELRRNREAIEEAYGLRFFRPRMMVLMGRRSEYLPHELRKAESDLPHLTITTYDDLVERVRSRMRLAKRSWH